MKQLLLSLLLALLLNIFAGCSGTAEPQITLEPDAPQATAVPAHSADNGTPTRPPVSPTMTPIVSPTPEASSTPANSPTPAGSPATVIEVINEVTAHAHPDTGWENAWVEMSIFQGGEVWAKEASTSRLDINHSLIRVAPNTIFTLEQPDPDTVQLNLQEGQIWLNVTGLEEDSTFEIETPNATASVRGTLFSVRVTEDEGTLVSTQDGAVVLQAMATAVTVAAGQESIAPPAAPPSPPEPISPQEQLRWGMAIKSTLDVVLPAYQVVAELHISGNTVNHSLSYNGRYLSLASIIYTPDIYSHTVRTYDLNIGAMIDGIIPAKAYEPIFSPANEQFAYIEYTDAGSIICTGSTTVGNLPTCFGEYNYISQITWSPDGTWLLLQGVLGAANQATNFYLIRPDGSELTPLTSGEEQDKTSPSWSPDGTQIAYMVRPVHEYDSPAEVWVMAADGADQQLVFNDANAYSTAAWLPDTNQLIVPGHESGLWAIPLDGSTPDTLPGTADYYGYDPTTAATAAGWPLLFTYYDAATHVSSLYYVAADGSSAKIADTSWGPIWAANRRRVAFGFVDKQGEIPQTTVIVLETEPDFYP